MSNNFEKEVKERYLDNQSSWMFFDRSVDAIGEDEPKLVVEKLSIKIQLEILKELQFLNKNLCLKTKPKK